MDIAFTEKKENVLMGRTEVKGLLKFEGSTPSNANLIESIAKQLKAEAGNIVIRHLHTRYSKQEAAFEAVVYNSVESRKKAERMTPQEKKKLEEAKKAQQEKKE